MLLLLSYSESVNSSESFNLLCDEFADVKLAVMTRLLFSDFAHAVMHVHKG
jgi:hypothetical protein